LPEAIPKREELRRVEKTLECGFLSKNNNFTSTAQISVSLQIGGVANNLLPHGDS